MPSWLRWLGVVALSSLGSLGCGTGNGSSAPADPCSHAHATSDSFPGDVANQLDQLLAQLADESGAPGVAAMVTLPNGQHWFSAAGLANVNTDEPLGPSARFRIGSITKMFTSAAVLLLMEEGKWSLSDPVDDWVAGWDFGPEVTLERLLNHTTGIYNYTDDPAFIVEMHDEVSPQDVIDFALQHAPVHAPGAGYSYSNTGYYLLGLALEAVTDKSFEAIVRERLIEPATLTATYMEQYESGDCPAVQGHLAGATAITEGFSMSWA